MERQGLSFVHTTELGREQKEVDQAVLILLSEYSDPSRDTEYQIHASTPAIHSFVRAYRILISHNYIRLVKI